ncbi:uncharacterized protein LOC127031859 isoform X2 [Gopherus flavomarginatus]|uniref:uncharacterized protein LOC127031859 isoform X2 n=1 Tax=Gopherus flavomarginatus TaxID=286002 RepID=UPI0021CBFC8C|nr:uncharacterized protein LOC127031859 isoform X2 [Gopherus flavomarginatus]
MSDPRAKIKETTMIRKWLLPSLWLITALMFFLFLLNLYDSFILPGTLCKTGSAPSSPAPIPETEPRPSPSLRDVQTAAVTKKERTRKSREIGTKGPKKLVVKDIKNWPWYKRRNIMWWQGGRCGKYHCGIDWSYIRPLPAICPAPYVPSACSTIPELLKVYITHTPIPPMPTPPVPAPTPQPPTIHPHQTPDPIPLLPTTSTMIQWPRLSPSSDSFLNCSTKLFFWMQGHVYKRTIKWNTFGRVFLTYTDITTAVNYTGPPYTTMEIIAQWATTVDLMLVPGLCHTPDAQGPKCFLVTQVTKTDILTKKVCPAPLSFTCVETIPITIENITSTLIQYTPSYSVNISMAKQGIIVHDQ